MELRRDLVLRNIGGDLIIVDPGQGMVDLSVVFTLNETAAFVWNSLQGTVFSIDMLVDLLVKEYDVSVEVACLDAEELLRNFAEKGLLIV